MAFDLTTYLSKNLPTLCATQFVCPETGKQNTFGAVGGSLWLRVLLVICNTAQNRLFFGGMRRLTTEARTNNDGAYYWLEVFEQVGWLTPNGTHAMDHGKRGKPAKCWLVTLPDLPDLVQEVWQLPAPQTQAQVVQLDQHQRTKGNRKRTGTAQTIGAHTSNLAHQLAPDYATQPHAAQVAATQLAQALSSDTQQAMHEAENCIRAKVQEQQLSPLQAVSVIEQAKGSWLAVYGNRTAPAQQVHAGLAQGLCTATQAVQYLASGVCAKTDLVQFVRGAASN